MNTSGIVRLTGSARGRSRATIANGLVFTVATAADAGATLAQQARATLNALSANLVEAGSARERILSATVYLADIGSKPELDAAWNAWVGDDGLWPQRACLQVTLPEGVLVEVTAIAVTGIGSDADRVDRHSRGGST